MTAEPADTRIDSTALETVSVLCPLCGSAPDTTFATVNGYRITRCGPCDFLFVNPRPTEKSLTALYSSRKNPYHAEGFEPFAFESRVLSQILARINKYVRGGDLLEVGCGRGDLLEVARRAGFSVTGCDFFGGRRPTDQNISLVDGDLKEARFPDNSFDIVVNRNTLEHTFDPGVEMQEIRRILKPRGHLYLKVPNVAFEHGWRCRLAFRSPHLLDPPYHLNYFNPASLKKLLQVSGLEFLSWFIERPSLERRWSANLSRQAFYRLTQGCCVLTAGLVFPKIVLTCFARKP